MNNCYDFKKTEPVCHGNCSQSSDVLFRKVLIPTALGDENTNPPANGAYKNSLVVYEKTGTVYIYDSDGIYTKLQLDPSSSSYDQLLNRPQINDVTLSGSKTSADLGLVGSENAVLTGTTNAENIVVSGDLTTDSLDVTNSITVPTPSDANDAANKSYVDTKATKITLYSDGNAIYSDVDMTQQLTYVQIKAMVDDIHNIVVIDNSNYELRYQYENAQGSENAIWFNANTMLAGKPYLYRIIVNSNDAVLNDEMELVQTSDLSDKSIHGSHTLTQAELDAQIAAGTLVAGDWYGVIE